MSGLEDKLLCVALDHLERALGGSSASTAATDASGPPSAPPTLPSNPSPGGRIPPSGPQKPDEFYGLQDLEEEDDSWWQAMDNDERYQREHELSE